MLSLVAKLWHSMRDLIIPRELMQPGHDHGSGSTQLLLVRTQCYVHPPHGCGVTAAAWTILLGLLCGIMLEEPCREARSQQRRDFAGSWGHVLLWDRLP